MNPYIKIVGLGESGQKMMESVQKMVENSGFTEVDCIPYGKFSGRDFLCRELSLNESIRWRLLLLVADSDCGFGEPEIQGIINLAEVQGYMVGSFFTESFNSDVHSVAFYSMQVPTDMAARVFDFVKSLRMSGFVNLDFADVAALLRRKDGSTSQLNYTAAR